MMNNSAGWLALGVLASASLLMVFFVSPMIDPDAKPIGAAINAAGDAVKEIVTEPLPTDKPSLLPEKTPAETVSVAPSFDILRVEPDGSTVVAGRAEPNSTLEVTDGASVVAKVEVGPSGDFAAVFDKPLTPGDHQLVLKATGKDGKSAVSEETATVSVPTDQNTGKLLAMVTKPGKASRLITTPKAATASAPTGTAASAETAMANAAATDMAIENQTAENQKGDDQKLETALPGFPALPSGSNELASSAPGVASDMVAAHEPASPPATEPSIPELRVTAVEVEGAKIFVAGAAKSGLSLRGAADGKPIGVARAGPTGNFVIEGETELSVGEHRISVDALGSGGQVLMRVEVPFNRPAGDQFAAVAAANTPAPAGNSTEAAGSTAPVKPVDPAQIDDAGFNKLRQETIQALKLLRGLYEDGKQPSLESMLAARSATAIALKSLVEYQLPVDAAASSRMVAEATAKDAAAALAALDALPKDVASIGSGLQKIGDMIARAVGPVVARQVQSVEIASATRPADGAIGDATPTIRQEALTHSDRHSVIIRQGDTLWQISRRLYGQGVRYTTIYLANQQQIANPDIIQPGQIFGVPEEYRPDSEEIHRQRLINDRAYPSPLPPARLFKPTATQAGR